MMTTFDTDEILYKLLNGKLNISGAVYYSNERPVDSQLEDVVIGTIFLTQTAIPQVGKSNINIYAPDIAVGNRHVQDAKLATLASEVVEIIKNAQVNSVLLSVLQQTCIKIEDLNQHCVNVQVEWNIQKQ